MDCNSVIYDAVHSIPFEDNCAAYEKQVIDMVILSIEDYIKIIKPSSTLYIAFDGVAPFAKMEQQRVRRYKNKFITNTTTGDSSNKWDTSAITPGTPFMQTLSKRIQYAFINMEQKYRIGKIIVSGSNEPGEGEHKLFAYLRDHPCLNENIALYGLDSDLIMLSIFHLQYCKNVYIFREAPEFLKQYFPIDPSYDSKMPYFLDMKVLSSSILTEMRCAHHDNHRIHDYIFLCFFMGNDFLPHFPSMNIRTHGIQVILDIYRMYIGNKPDTYIINRDNTIQWKHVNKLVSEIAKREHELLTIEYSSRHKLSKKRYSLSTEQDKNDYFQNVPTIYQMDEDYISPDNSQWEDRYYKTLFHCPRDKQHVSDICTNYLEGLEWVFKYYSTGCPHWKWKYNYHYPPLFADLCKYVPHFHTEFIHDTTTVTKFPHVPFSHFTQLSYVLPPQNHNLLPFKITDFLKKHYKHLYVDDIHYQWAFCRYFWEAHPDLPTISLELLEQWDIQYRLSFDNTPAV
jgi:5'-3' exonuclease